jgi:hypothetical protein
LESVFNFKATVPIVTDVDIGKWGGGISLKEFMTQRGMEDEYNKLFKY